MQQRLDEPRPRRWIGWILIANACIGSLSTLLHARGSVARAWPSA